jgi:hypothetical protein
MSSVVIIFITCEGDSQDCIRPETVFARVAKMRHFRIVRM